VPQPEVRKQKPRPKAQPRSATLTREEAVEVWGGKSQSAWLARLSSAYTQTCEEVLEEQFANLADGLTFPEGVLDSVSGASIWASAR
jgi:hypothetical protein